MELTKSQINRFWGKVDTSGPCWLWTSYKNEKGYGRFGLNYKHQYAHRVSYSLNKGTIPANQVIDHLCRNTSCVNPEHLEVVSQKENVLRGEGPSAKQAKQTACIRGHIFDVQNTYIRRMGKRSCRMCAKALQQKLRNRINQI